MKDYAVRFYSSKAWKDARKAYTKYRGGLCERCLDRGIYRAGELVHHKIHITPENINNPDITLDWNNMQLLCRDCHAEIHSRPAKRRYVVGENGEIIAVG